MAIEFYDVKEGKKVSIDESNVTKKVYTRTTKAGKEQQRHQWQYTRNCLKVQRRELHAALLDATTERGAAALEAEAKANARALRGLAAERHIRLPVVVPHDKSLSLADIQKLYTRGGR